MEEIFVFFRSLGATYAVYTNLFLAACFIFVFQPFHRNNRTIAFDARPLFKPPFLFLALFGLAYVAIGVPTIKGFLVYFITPLLLYIAGWVAVSSSKNPARKARNLIYATMVGNAIHALLNYLVNISNARGSNIDFFTQIVASDTISASINIIILSTVFCLFIAKSKIIKVIHIFAIVASLLYSLQIATRSTFLIAFISFVLCVILYIAVEKNRRQIAKLFVIIVTVCLLFLFFYSCNLFSFRSFLESSNMIERLNNGIGSSNSVRYERFFDGINNLFKYPMGSANISLYYHNTWLDVARIGGIIPFLFYLIYTVISIVHIIKLFRNKSLETHLRFLLLCVYIGVYLNLFVEPGMEGYIELIFEFIFINGMVDYFEYSRRQKGVSSEKRMRSINKTNLAFECKFE